MDPVPQAVIQRLMDSMQNRIAACIRADGGNTRVGAVSRFHHRDGFLSTHLQTRDEDTLALRVCVCRLFRKDVL